VNVIYLFIYLFISLLLHPGFNFLSLFSSQSLPPHLLISFSSGKEEASNGAGISLDASFHTEIRGGSPVERKGPKDRKLRQRHSSPAPSFFFFFFGSFFFFSELGTEPRALHFLGKRSTTELNPQPPLPPLLGVPCEDQATPLLDVS